MSDRDMSEDRAYYLRRARQERAAAACTEDNSVTLAHLKLAEEYERRAGVEASVPPMAQPQGA